MVMFALLLLSYYLTLQTVRDGPPLWPSISPPTGRVVSQQKICRPFCGLQQVMGKANRKRIILSPARAAMPYPSGT